MHKKPATHRKRSASGAAYDFADEDQASDSDGAISVDTRSGSDHGERDGVGPAADKGADDKDEGFADFNRKMKLDEFLSTKRLLNNAAVEQALEGAFHSKGQAQQAGITP